jgi:tetratricopeptide (TPR) repeat protein
VVRKKLGNLCLQHLGLPDEAQQHFKAILSHRADDKEAFKGMVGLLRSHGTAQELVDLYEQRLMQELPDPERLETIASLAEIYLHSSYDPDAFLRWIKEGRAIRQDHPNLVRLLVQFHEKNDNTGELIPLLSWYVNYLDAKREYKAAADHAHSLARHYVGQKNYSEAAVYAKMATRYAPDSIDNILTHGEILELTGEWSLARNVYQGLFMFEGKMEAPKMKAEVFFRMARVCGKLKDKAKAKQYIQRCLDCQPDHEEGVLLAQKFH